MDVKNTKAVRIGEKERKGWKERKKGRNKIKKKYKFVFVSNICYYPLTLL